jgi:acyl CoA:acetate/3-ketoacid CoA transferase beta subunit
MVNYTTEEVVVCEIARSFGPADDFILSVTGNCGLVAGALAKELYAPRLNFYTAAKGTGAFLRNVRYPFVFGAPPEAFIETLVSMTEVFECVGRGKWCIMMQPVQIDKYGYMNLSLVGDKTRPSAVFVGSRGVPDNTVNAPFILYFVPNHVKRVFVEEVDFISGLGYGKERKDGTIKWGAPAKIITNLCVMDFDKESGRVRLKSIHNGVTLDQVKENTGFDLILPDVIPETEPPTDQELHWIREIIDPSGISRLDFVKGEEFNKILSDIMRGTTYQSLYSKR